MKKKLIKTILSLSLILIMFFIGYHFNDTTMQFKHWISLILFEIVFQLRVGDYIDKMNDE